MPLQLKKKNTTQRESPFPLLLLITSLSRAPEQTLENVSKVMHFATLSPPTALKAPCRPYNVQHGLDPAYLPDCSVNITRHPADFCHLNLARPVPHPISLLFIPLMEHITINSVHCHSSRVLTRLRAARGRNLCPFWSPRTRSILVERINILSYSSVTSERFQSHPEHPFLLQNLPLGTRKADLVSSHGIPTWCPDYNSPLRSPSHPSTKISLRVRSS